MRVGAARDRVSFQRGIKVSDGGGGHSITWQNIKTVWGHLAVERGTERVQTGRIDTPTSAVLRVRYSSDLASLSSTDRVMINGEPYNINGTPENRDRRKRELEMTVTKGVAY